MRFAWCLLVTLACSGQSGGAQHYHLDVSPAFSDEQSRAIFDAATEWEQRSGNYVTFDGDASEFDYGVIRVDLVTGAQLSAEFGGGAIGLDTPHGHSSHIEIAEGLDPRTFHQTALHELGHALGLVHLTPGNVMCADTVCATLDVRCGDLQELVQHPVTGCIL